MLEAMARIAPSQLNEAMARFAPRRNGTTSLDQSFRVKIPEKGGDVDSKLFSAPHRYSVPQPPAS
jgi:hypothetical protein